MRTLSDEFHHKGPSPIARGANSPIYLYILEIFFKKKNNGTSPIARGADSPICYMCVKRDLL